MSPRSSAPDPDDGRAREPERGGWPLFFVTVALLALGLVPLALRRQVARVEGEITEVLEPARGLALDLALIHARQIARFQDYLLSGDVGSLQRYREARASEDTVYARLLDLSGEMELDVREKLAELSTVVARWHLRHEDALASDSARSDYLGAITEDQRRNDELLEASHVLTDAISEKAAAGRERMDRARTLQFRLTLLLVAVALAATALVADIGRRQRALVGEARAQRGRAVRARREVDAILAATGDGVLGLDLAGRCTSLNRTGGRLLGRQIGDVRGMDVHDVIHGPEGGSHERESCPIKEAIRSGTTVRETEDVLLCRDGTSIPIQWTVGPMSDGLEVNGAVLTFTDMRGIREAQDALRQAVHARDEVVAVVSHDLRNPLGTISSAAELLLDLDLPPAKKREHLEIIVRASRRMNRLIQDLLDVARIEGGGISVELEEVEIGPLVREAVEVFEPRARKRGLRFGAVTEPDLPPMWADRDRLFQVLSNLIGNALKFTSEGGVRIDARRDGSRVVFSVADTGQGISDEDLEHIFDRFWQQRRSDRQGAGLGLGIVRGIVSAHGGSVWVESEPGEGSVFNFDIPFAAAHGERVPREEEVEAG